MAPGHSTYQGSNYALSFGAIITSLILIAVLWKARAGIFKLMIKKMFSMKYTWSEGLEQTATLDIFGEKFVLKNRKQCCFVVPRVCLWLMIGVVIGVTLMVFIDGLILNVIYLPSNEKCPDDGDMDCYSTKQARYFYCNSSDILVPDSMGTSICYRWFKRGISTLEVLEQIGLCTGLFEVFSWGVGLYLRWLLFAYKFPDPANAANYAHPYLALISTSVSFAIPIVILIVLTVYYISITGLTIAVIIGLLFIVVPMQVLVWSWRRNKRLTIMTELEFNRMGVATVEKQQTTIEIQ
ncbi:unnamed protein product [Adineta ricciae]|uniref:Uncharacterized protein n=1 Tax=Adineta ricciae TaxID=249248 RepID=A0A815SVB3_ADIRI|nr:unnamed protein product [Adineta ricciae]CAF1582937.1 unnamed protein product [Adineta ricciae]